MVLAPEPGNTAFDVSRDDVITGPTYGAYDAQAWLRNNSNYICQVSWSRIY